jgi:glutamyl-Q tRNA(Asp) synthetase
MMRAIITRYAPAPTGFLHIGHVVNAIYVWGIARRVGGRMLLRIEDHDRQRSRTEYDSAIVEDLAWLGFVPDEPPARQSERDSVYERALDSLRARGLVYACACSRAQIATAAALKGYATANATAAARDDRSAANETMPPARANGFAANDATPPAHANKSEATDTTPPANDGTVMVPVVVPVAQPFRAARASAADEELCYPGTCRDRGLAEAPGLSVRVRFEPTVETFDDVRHGRQEQRPSEQCGDLLVRDREGNWTYQFAATVDDWQQGVTLVVRGDDLLDSTGRQIQLARLLGRAEPPRFLHHPLIMKSATQKLSKSDRDTGVRDLRAQGWTPEAVIGQAAALAGLLSEPRDVRAADVSSMMSWQAL